MGLLGEELIGPWKCWKNTAMKSFYDRQRQQAPALPPSMEVGYLDPPLDKIVTDEYYARKTREIHASKRLDKPLNLSQWFPNGPTLITPILGTNWKNITTCATRPGKT